MKRKARKQMEVKPILALPEGLELIKLEQRNEMLIITAASTQCAPRGPLCGSVGRRVHSRYTRQVADLPCGGQPLRLLLQVRKYFCEGATCQRKILVECLAPFIDTHGHVTRRLFQVVQVIGLATGGRLGVRLTDRIGIATSRQTILRRIMALPTEPAAPIIELGIDDFSFRRGRSFGTVLVNLQTRQIIDILASRKAEIVAEWMASHPEIGHSTVSRWIAAGTLPETRRGPYASRIDPYLPSLFEWWDSGCHNMVRLHQELV